MSDIDRLIEAIGMAAEQKLDQKKPSGFKKALIVFIIIAVCVLLYYIT